MVVMVTMLHHLFALSGVSIERACVRSR